MKLNSQEKRDLDKFAKFLALKATQIIVQSRLGEKVSTICKPQFSSSDWFNLNITDIPEVLAEAKKVLNGEILCSRLPLCVEISLLTSEGDQMVLETWCLGLSPERCEPTPRITNTIYNRMGILLKSLVTATRMVPAHKLARIQGSDTFVLCYRIYMGEPLEQCLGEGYKHHVIGQICSPIGTFQLSVSYRTKLTFSPTQSERNNQITAIHDQLNSNSDPTLLKDKNSEVDLSKPLKLGAFASPSKLKSLEDSKHMLVPDIPLPLKRLLEEESDEDSTEIGETDQEKNENKESSIESKMNMMKMESSTDSTDDYIMVDLKRAVRILSKIGPVEHFKTLSILTMISVYIYEFVCFVFKNKNYFESEIVQHTYRTRMKNRLLPPYIKEHAPFANTKKLEMGNFIREWQSPTQLETFTDITPNEESGSTKNFQTFDTDWSEYEELTEVLYEIDENY